MGNTYQKPSVNGVRDEYKALRAKYEGLPMAEIAEDFACRFCKSPNYDREYMIDFLVRYDVAIAKHVYADYGEIRRVLHHVS